MYKYKYSFDIPTECKINTDLGAEKFNDIKKEITQTAECIINKSTYPDGTILEMHQYSDKVDIYSTKEIKQDENGQYYISK